MQARTTLAHLPTTFGPWPEHALYDSIARWRDAAACQGWPQQADFDRLIEHARACGQPLPPRQRFLRDADPELYYEMHIGSTGEVPTRGDNWHDWFNALCWLSWPRSKLAMNARQVAAINGDEFRRGPRRDAPAQAEPAYRPLSGIRTYRPADGGASREIPVKRAPAPVQEQVPGAVRINKRLADMGLCSRREADEWVDKGWVRVNGELAVMGQNVVAADRITVEREARDRQDQQVTILIHKPMGYVSGQAEDGHEPAVVLVTPQNHWNQDTSRTRFNFAQLKGLAPCGRLDIDSVGLLVMTQDGRVARQIIGEDSEMDKEYLVRVTYGDRDIDVQSVFPAEQLARLCHGLSLDGEELKPAKVDWQNPEQLRFVLTEGKKRQIRRMCELVGLRVVGLKRIRIGRVTLGNLPVGQWRYLGAHEGF